MKSLADLHEYYRTRLKTDLADLEAQRKQIIKRASIIIGIGIGLAFLLLAFVRPFNITLLIILGFIVAAAVWFATGALYKRFRGDFKRKIIAKIVAFVDPALAYDADRCIPEEIYQLSGIFQHDVDRYTGDDRVSGNIDKTDIVFSEIHSEYKTVHTDSKGRTHTEWHTIFKGLFFSADFNKHFRGTTYVLPDVAESLFGFLGSKLQSFNKTHGSLVKMEDPDFERAFVVYASDQTEAFYILSTSLMKRILAFKNKSGREIFLSFVGTRVYVAVSYRRSLFEPRVYSTVLNFGPIEEYYEDLALALGIAEDLNLNTRIWTKE